MKPSTPPPLPVWQAPPERPIVDVGLAVLCLSIALLLTITVVFVVPRCQDMFKDFGVKLPALTISVLDFSRFCVRRTYDASGELHVNVMGLALVWLLAALPPFVVPLVGSRGFSRASRLAAALILVLLLGWLLVGLLWPMTTLIHAVSSGGKKGG